jgi:hypothetical protein
LRKAEASIKEVKMKRLSVLLFSLIISMTPAAGWGATQTFTGNVTGNAATVTTNANMAGDVVSVGNATTIKEAPVIKAVTLTPSTEKVNNGGFDSVTTGWTASDGTIASVAGGQSGNCLEVTMTASPSYAYAYQSIATTVGKKYLFSAYVKKGTATNGQILISNGNFYAADVWTKSGITDAGWTQYTTVITAANAATFITFVAPTGSNTQTMLFDTVSLTELPLTVSGNAEITGNIGVNAIPVYSNNAAAIAGGLKAGQFYRVNAATDPEPLYIVH